MEEGARVFELSMDVEAGFTFVKTWVRLGNGAKLEESFKELNNDRAG